MSNYIGVRCPICNKKFSEADDIVVCPVCGAPHHRTCYDEKKQCAFIEDHLSGKEWSDPAGTVPPHEQKKDGQSKTCQRCGTDNPKDTVFCSACGNPMTIEPPKYKDDDSQAHQWVFPGFTMQIDSISMLYGGVNPDDKIDDENVADIAKYVGSGSGYYIPRFKIMSEKGHSLMPNFAALFFHFFYYFYRKMYLVGTLMLALYMLSMIPNFIYTKEVFPLLMQQMGYAVTNTVEVNQTLIDHYFWLAGVTRTINFVIGVVVSMIANRLYYSHTIKAVHQIRKSAEDQNFDKGKYEYILSTTGGTSKGAVIVAVSVLAFIQIAFALYLNYVYMII